MPMVFEAETRGQKVVSR
jgi:hypothetical protein